MGPQSLVFLLRVRVAESTWPILIECLATIRNLNWEHCPTRVSLHLRLYWALCVVW